MKYLLALAVFALLLTPVSLGNQSALADSCNNPQQRKC